MTLRSRCSSCYCCYSFVLLLLLLWRLLCKRLMSKQNARKITKKQRLSVCHSPSHSHTLPLSVPPVGLVSPYLHKSPSRMQTPIRVTAKQTKVSIKGQSQSQSQSLLPCSLPSSLFCSLFLPLLSHSLAALNGLKAKGAGREENASQFAL